MSIKQTIKVSVGLFIFTFNEHNVIMKIFIFLILHINIGFLFIHLFPTITGWKLTISSLLLALILLMLIDLIWPRQKYSNEMDTE